MKTIVKILLLAIAFISFTTNMSAAGNEPSEDDSKIVVTTSNNSTLNLQLFNLDNEKTSIKIKDQAGELIYFKKVKDNDKFASRIDLSNLENGNYNLYVSREEKRFVQPITLMDNEVITGALVEVLKPQLTVEEGTFTITQKGTIISNVSVLNRKGKVIFTKYFGEATKEASDLRFVLSDDSIGSSVIRVEVAGEYYYYDIASK